MKTRHVRINNNVYGLFAGHRAILVSKNGGVITASGISEPEKKEQLKEYSFIDKARNQIGGAYKLALGHFR